jgi:cell division protein FtsB
MKNVFIISVIVIAIGYMFVIMKDKYQTMKETNSQIEQQKKK